MHVVCEHVLRSVNVCVCCVNCCLSSSLVFRGSCPVNPNHILLLLINPFTSGGSCISGPWCCRALWCHQSSSLPLQVVTVLKKACYQQWNFRCDRNFHSAISKHCAKNSQQFAGYGHCHLKLVMSFEARVCASANRTRSRRTDFWVHTAAEPVASRIQLSIMMFLLLWPQIKS